MINPPDQLSLSTKKKLIGFLLTKYHYLSIDEFIVLFHQYGVLVGRNTIINYLNELEHAKFIKEVEPEIYSRL